jgi:hypothetical protein
MVAFPHWPSLIRGVSALKGHAKDTKEEIVSQGEFKIPSGFSMGTFRKLLLITASRRFRIRVRKAVNFERPI